MPEYLAPGVFIEEIERGPKPIEGVATSTTAMLGEAERGPTQPTLVTSYGEYLRRFGGVFGADRFLPYAAKQFFDNGGRRVFVTRIVGAGGVASTATFGDLTVTAVGAGTAGDRIWVRLDDSTTEDSSGPIGFRMQVFYWDRALAGVPFDPVANPEQLPRPSIFEDFDDLVANEDSPNYWEKRVNNGNSSLVELSLAAGGTLPSGTGGGALAGGADGATPLTAADITGDPLLPPDQRTGLAALDLDPYREVAIVAAPGITDVASQQAIITHCERQRFRFAVLDSPPNQGNIANIDPRTNVADSKYAAFYYPWIIVSDPRTANRVKTPPSGAVCGIYALTDNTRGVWKAPANETVAGALALEYDINHAGQEVLNPRGVNVIRRFPGRGIRVWGARTLSSDPLWKYVNVRRLFIYLEASIYNSTQWVVFEPNDQRLWARVKQTVTLFLRNEWREGALFGAKEEEAFSVAVGRETMTENDILNGRLIVEVGIAPVRPAEFVIFRVFQKTAEASS